MVGVKKNFTITEANTLTNPCNITWSKENLTVVRDGYLGWGTRIHVVAEQQYKQPVMIANAIVISENRDILIIIPSK